MNNEYDDLLASEGAKDEARTALRASVIGALPTNPDQYAEAKRLARTTGVPAPVVERNMDEVKKQATLNEYDALIERAPVTASKFQNPEFAKVAHDERDQLAGMESIIASAPQPEIYGSVLTPTGRGIFSPTAQPQPQPAATPPALDPAKVQAEMLRRFGFKGASTIDRKIDGVLANETRAQLSPWDGKTQEFGYADAARKGVAMVKLTWDFLADQLAGSLGMDQTETRRIMADTQRYMQGLGKDFDTELAMDLARKQGGDSVVGVLGALPGAIGATDNPFDVVGKFATEQLVASSIGAGVGSMAAAPLRRSAAAYITNQALARSVGVALTGASASGTAVVLQSLGSNYQEGLSTGLTPDEAGRRAWVKTLAEVPANALAGALVGLKIGPNQITNILAQTGVQAAAGGIGAASASVAVGEKIDPLEIALEIAGEGIGAAPDLVVSGALTPASIVSRKFQMEREAQAAAAKASADHLTRILQAAEASKTRARDPETFAQLVQDAAEASGTAPTEVFIDAQPLVDTLQKAGMTEAQIREALPSVAEQLGDEYDTGGSVAIPIGEAVAAFAGTGAEADLVRFARTTEDGYSVADSEQALAALDEMDSDAQRIIAEQQDAEAWMQSAKMVEDTIFAQLDRAGRFSSDVNRTYATLLRNYYVTQADVMGITPEELYRQFPLTASGVAPTGQVLNQPGGEIATIFDEDGEFTSTDDLIAGLRDGRLLVHARVPDGTDFRYGIEPSAGAFLRSTEAWQQAEEDTGAGPELTFFSDSLDWAKSTILQKVRAAEDAGLELVFVRKGEGLQKSLGNGRVVLPDGREVSYEMSPLADYESDLYRAEPAGVESGDWYTNKPQDVVAVAPAADFLKRAEPPTTFDQEVKGTTPYAADTIEVDGKTRPVVNNKGQRIAQTEEGLRNFWRWFGESKVVDEQGRPLVVYHGTTSDFDTFDPAVLGASTGVSDARKGFFFVDSGTAASEFTWKDGDMVGNVMPVYLSVQDALAVNLPGEWAPGKYDAALDQAKRAGKDGVIVRGAETLGKAGDYYITFTPTQIKSATGNRGTYDPADPNTLHQSAYSYTDEATGLPLNPDGTVTVYHHTSAEKAAQIRTTGRLVSAGEPDVYVTTRAETDTGYGDTAVPVRVDPATLTLDDEFPDGRQDFRISVGKPGGSIAVKVILPGDEVLYQSGVGAPHPFTSFTREQFLGNPKITSDANSATLQPRVLTTVEPAEAEPFAAGKGLTAKYSPDGAAVFDGDKVIASYNFGDTLVVDKKYRRQGIAEELVYQWRMRNPQAKTARERTRKSQALQEKVWDRIERELNDQGNNVLFQPAYHGSPYRFSKFSLEHMGKGEGAQAYGWGLYFAGSKELADYYRDYLSDSTYAFKVDGNEIDLDSLPPMESIAVQSLGQPYANAPEQLIDRLRSAGASVEDITAAAEALERYSGRVAYERRNNGQLYRVEIPDDERLLLWDKPLSEQPSQVREALQKYDLGSDEDSAISEFAKRNNLSLDEAVAFFADEFEVAQRGEEIYRRLAERLGSDEAASKHLNSLGIAGIKYLDGTSRADGDGSYNYVIFDDAAIEIVNTFYQQQQNGEAEARGSFNPTTLNIALLEKADLSTFLHEAGHFFFEMQATIAARPDAPARIVDDVNTLLKEVSFKGTAAEWLAQPLNTRRESHEKVAESFEQYLITGEAPTVELQGLFNQMRAWMLAVYKTLKQFFAVNKRAGMTAEVAGVFDRMLASDATIAETKRVRAMSPLFKSAEEAGMDAAGWAAYQDDAGQMDADARRDLDARQVRDMKWLRSARSKALKALQADASAKRREARIEARRRLLQEPVYRAMQFLRGKVEQAPVEKKAKGLDTRRDDLLTAIAKLGGLNKDLVVAEWGIDPKDFAKSPVFGKPILRSGKAGLSPDGMAEALAEVGYLQPKDGDRYALSDLEAMLDDSARGIQHYSLDADYDLIHGYKTLPVAADLGEQPFAAGRLSRPDLEARFANSDVDWQKLGVGRRGMIAEVGMDADAVANIVGFNTGEEMVKALLAAESLHDATEALTDQIMLERHGDITSPEGLQRAADAALANDAHAKLLATEYARLNKAVGSPRAVQMAAKEAAERMVDRQAVRLARPDKSTAAAARAGKAAEKAHAAGNLDEAAGFKRNQILNTAIARAQRELRAFVEKAQGDFANMFGKDDQRAKTRDMNLVNLARAALAQYGLAPTSGGMKALQYLDLVTQYDPALAENLKSMLAAMPEGKDFRDITAGEFRTVASLVRGMWEMSRGVKQITIDGKKVEIDAAADELVAAVLANNGGEQGTLPGYSGTTTTADDLRVGALGIKSMLTRVEQWADFMGPAFKRFIWQPVSEAVTRYRVRRNEMVKQYRDLLKAIEPDLTFHKIHAPELGMGGFTFNAGKSEVLHAILHSGNQSNLRKLLLGRGWATVDEAGNLDTSRWDAFVKRMAAEGVITRADMDFVQGVWDLLETVKGDAQKAHRELYGYYFNEVTATPFVDPFGVERRGGYVPALADGLSSPDAMQKREQEELLHAGNSFMFPSTGKGFTQARVEYNRPLELDLRSIGSHLDKVTRFAYIEPAVRDVGKLLINKRVARTLNGYDQTIISQMLNPWLQRAARQTVSVPGKNRWADKFFNGLRSRSGVVIMFANVVNTLQQLTGFSVAALKVPAPALLRATYRMVTDPKRMSAEAAALSPWLAERMAGQSFEMQQEIKNILVNPNPVVKGNEFLKHNAYFMQQAMQNMMDPIIWWGAYDNAVANGANQRDAIRAGDEAVRTTQGTFAPEDVSAFESNTAFVRLFTQFYGYFNMLANTIGAEAKKAIRDMGYGAATPRLLFIWFAGLALPAVVAEIIARGLPDDEDDEDGDGTLDEWLALFFGSQGRTLAAMVPGAGQAASLAVNLTDDKVYNDRLSISPGMSMAETTIRGGVNLLQGEVFDERLTKTEVRDTLTLIGMATGAPTGAIARSAGYLVDVENGRADPETPVDYAIGLTTGR